MVCGSYVVTVNDIKGAGVCQSLAGLELQREPRLNERAQIAPGGHAIHDVHAAQLEVGN